MADRPWPRLRTRRTLVTLAGAVLAALVLWRMRPIEPPPAAPPVPDPDPGVKPKG